jgi:hypothetical protein
MNIDIHLWRYSDAVVESHDRTGSCRYPRLKNNIIICYYEITDL